MHFNGQSSWRVGLYSLSVGLGFYLSAAASACRAPVASHVQVGTEQSCASCHRNEYVEATEPLHFSAISETCEDCHSNSTWSPARGGENHSWELKGAHATMQCNGCHAVTNPVYEGTETECIACHGDARDEVEEPSHKDFSEDCTTCHSQDAWTPALFDHDTWPLEGAHLDTTCGDCHTGTPPQYEGTPTECVDCHGDEREMVTEPPHGGFSETCTDCHTVQAWKPAEFPDHEWPLEGAHAQAFCADCHTGTPARFEGTPTDCASCHNDERAQVVDPSHEGFSETCQECHNVQAWRPALFPNHSWPLEGAHSQALCADCHGTPPTYEGTASDCASCHGQEALTVVIPSHAGFSQDCSTCHTTFGWLGAAFEHDSFPLTGAHSVTACADCHTGNPPVFEGLSSDCVSCHDGDRDLATPPHTGFSQDCTDCHSTASWSGAAFQHTQAFPLQGGHSGPECGDCHTGTPAVFDGLNAACVNCHRDDYDGSPFPGHNTFATTCQDCHTIQAWRPASGGNHPQNRFSITGRHDFACNECHKADLGPNGAGNADCVGCHTGEHTLARMDRVHQGEVNGYPTGGNRAPNFCLRCHPDGSE